MKNATSLNPYGNFVGLYEDMKIVDMENSINAKKSELDSNTYTRNSNYDIVRINSFEEASEYSKYTSWCITKEHSAFDSYTNDGINQFYFCLEKGFENVPKVPTQDAPLDKYGLFTMSA